MKIKEYDWLCKHTKKVRSSQPCIQWILYWNRRKWSIYCKIWIWILQNLFYLRWVTDSCRDGWNVQNCSTSQVQIFGGQLNVQNLCWMKCMKSANFLQSLNMNTAEFALSQLFEHKLCVISEIHVDVVVLVVWVAFVWFVVCYVWLIKLACMRCRCGMNILNFGLSPLRLVYMKFLMA